jgi:hypothetical protein
MQKLSKKKLEQLEAVFSRLERAGRIRRYQLRYEQSEKGRATRRRYYETYRKGSAEWRELDRLRHRSWRTAQRIRETRF